ncbi:gephyrin-like molybdotransferase Glp [Paracoccus luteus]|uniref:molybdopterin molybdotransferase MoeA n=1 Tax=Paracoccus luteus TaxID=2508543 RepID=UPI00106F8E5B|nr:gephyrin-like molybdotransferase Glp [Paracoccus luteus]
MISVDEALALVLDLAPAPQGETVALVDAAGRWLLEPAASRMTQPPFDAAAMDGYAVRAADGAGPLAVVGQSAAGAGWTGTLGAGQAVRIFTGAPVPQGADRVVMQEDARRDGDLVTLETTSSKTNIRPRGNDFSSGDTLGAGRRLDAADIALLAAMNLPAVTVARAPRVAVLAGGDELVRPGEMPGAGQIISSNDLAVAAMVRAAGGIATILPLARDTEASLRQAFAAAAGHDVIVTIGGASVGDHDLVGRVAADLGIDRAFHRIAMRPGKPLMAGRLGTSAMLGLPGNPVSAMVCAVLFLQPLLRAMQGDPAPGPRLRHGVLGTALAAEGDRQHYLRATRTEDGEGIVVTPFADQDSARVRLMARADSLLVRPAGDAAKPAGSPVRFIALRN